MSLEDSDMVMPPDAETYAQLLYVKVKVLNEDVKKLEASNEKAHEEIKAQLKESLDHCWVNMKEHGDAIQELKEAKAHANGIQHIKDQQVLTKPHWVKINAGWVALAVVVLIEAVKLIKGI